jgi:hypothetical protein
MCFKVENKKKEKETVITKETITGIVIALCIILSLYYHYIYHERLDLRFNDLGDYIGSIGIIWGVSAIGSMIFGSLFFFIVEKTM